MGFELDGCYWFSAGLLTSLSICNGAAAVRNAAVAAVSMLHCRKLKGFCRVLWTISMPNWVACNMVTGNVAGLLRALPKIVMPVVTVASWMALIMILAVVS